MHTPKYTTFHNVTICIASDDPKAAYAALCDALATIDGDWHTDTYSHDEGEARPTTELFPEAEAV